MNDTQRNRLRMYKATRTFLDDNAGIWNGLVANSEARDGLDLRISTIDDHVTAQGAVLTGHTQNKQQLRATLENSILLVAGATAAYARSINDPVLLADVDLEPSYLSKLSEQLLDDAATRVETAADSVLASLAPYGVTAVEIGELNDARVAYDDAKAIPDAKRAERAGLTATLEPLFQETSQFLDGQLDVLMRRYKTTHPAFHAGYEAARVIIDLHGPGEDDPEPPPVP